MEALGTSWRLVRLAGLDEQRRDLTILSPLGENGRGEFAPVVLADSAGLAVQLDELFQHAEDTLSR